MQSNVHGMAITEVKEKEYGAETNIWKNNSWKVHKFNFKRLI